VRLVELLTSVLELVVVVALLGALIAAAATVGWPWCLPLGLVAVAAAAGVVLAAVAARREVRS
jgi:hypothetical protein